ncbi:conserved hypothetical protein [Leishmania mexicana MHOM/GT/2001/U1103]|uniref:EF-hand domain-containing protein n=1 Tax=Leishmania mexicana (strain MHOM/GT/2001/U1103) TaxID=929439 RepID=E9B132_LEIMU|nr:conserved hypothetical protein [Leishmania mexicana MHOM/GT/2001/U1103]CBZ28938.1 conserved hypothetical protein [Leishmania mexicana MHOM/GT/2001/U1103]
MESYVCHVTDAPEAHEPQQPSSPREDSNGDCTASKSEVLSRSSPSTPSSWVSARDLKGSGGENASMGGSGTPEETSVPAPQSAIATTGATAALVNLPQQSLAEQGKVPPDYAEAEEAHGEAGERAAYQCAEERSSYKYGGTVASENRLTGASTSSAYDSTGEVGSSGTAVAPHGSSNRVHVPAVSHNGAATARQKAREVKSTSCRPLHLASNDYVRAYALSLASSSSLPRQTPAQVVAPRYTPDRSPETKWSVSRVSTTSAVQHEVLPPIIVGSKKKARLRRSSTSAKPRTAPNKVSKATSTSRSMPAVSHASNPLSMAGSATARTVVPTEASYLTTYSTEGAMKDLLKHVDRNSFGFHLRSMFQRIDFAEVQREVQRGEKESAALQMCRRLFRIIAKNKDSMSVEDLHELLLTFTPCGVSLREGADFLWENCGGKLSFTFRDFLQYGAALRARLQDYELFERLSDQEKLIVTHARILPGKPLDDANTARVNLLRVADQQMQDQLPQDTRSLRLYEELFLVDYHERLHDAALIPASEIPQQGLKSDYAHEYGCQQQGSPFSGLPQLSVPVLKEDMEWRQTEVGHSTASDAAVHAAAAETRTAAVHGESEYPALSRSIHPVGATKAPGKAGSRTASRRKHPQRRYRAAAASSMGAGATYSDRSRRTGLGSERFVVDLQQQPLPPPQKKMGRFVEEEYWERRIMDDHLITQLQSMYKTQ